MGQGDRTEDQVRVWITLWRPDGRTLYVKVAKGGVVKDEATIEGVGRQLSVLLTGLDTPAGEGREAHDVTVTSRRPTTRPG